MPANLISYVGAVIAVSATSPATEDSSGFAALTYTTVGNATVAPETGDEVADVTADLLSGRTKHANGPKDGGARNIAYIYDASDAGQVIVRANNNTNTACSIKITDPDGKIEYVNGLLANFKRAERVGATGKIESGVIKVNTATVVV